MKPVKLGSHLSIAGGVHNALTEAAKLRCDCLQVFTKNQRQWQAPPLTEEQVGLFRQEKRRLGIDPVVAHDSYLINLATADRGVYKKSYAAFVDELERCERLGIVGLVTHPGAHLGMGEAKGLNRIGGAFKDVVKDTRGFTVKILIETTAGQGTSLGYRFEHIAEILAKVKRPERMGVCMDTCHLYAAGYDIVDDFDGVMQQFDDLIGLKEVRCVHMNDSLKPLGSRVDRHTHLGKGTLGAKPFKRILNDTRFSRTPLILETPKEELNGKDGDKVNLAQMRRWIQRK